MIENVTPKYCSMKIEADEFMELYKQNEVVFVDIRMKFETFTQRLKGSKAKDMRL